MRARFEHQLTLAREGVHTGDTSNDESPGGRSPGSFDLTRNLRLVPQFDEKDPVVFLFIRKYC